MLRIWILCLLFGGVAVCAAAQEVADHRQASWIWTGPQPAAIGEWECYARRMFRLEEKPAAASVLVTADNVYELYVNGVYVGEDGGYEAIYWSSLELYDIGELLQAGDNVIAARAKSLGGSGGLLIAARVATGPETVTEFATGPDWKVRVTFDEGWNEAGYDDSGWRAATVLAAHGGGPWGTLAYPGPVSPMSLNRLTLMEPGDDFAWPEGAVFVGGFVPLKEPENFTVSVLGSHAYFEHDGPTPAAMGHRLYSIVPARPDGKVTLLHDAGKGLIGSPSVSYDGRTIYFSMVPEGDFFWRVCRIAADGSGLEVLTRGYFHDYDPVELPDGRIVFSSTRIGSRDEYHANVASSLFVMHADGSHIEPLTYHIVADREPKVTADGSVVMVRADNFFERAKVETRIQQVRPDGTGGMVILGADREAIGLDGFHAAERNSAWLRVNGYGSPAPLPDGRVAAISQYGVVVSGVFNSGRFGAEKAGVEYVPYDMAALPDGRLLCTSLGRNWIGVMDLKLGKVARVYGEESIHSVAYLGPRTRPAEVASHLYPPDTRRADKTGYLLCQSVFATKQGNADLGRAKAVRIIEGRPFTLRSAMHRFGHIGVEGVELGTAPLAPDGSFYVEVPADRALAIQLVDAEGRNVVSEMSWLYVRPGERLSCVGCHNPRTAGPQTTVNPLAGRAEPVRLTGGTAAHRFRANNAGNGGVLNLQFDRFREAAAINLYGNEAARGGEEQKAPSSRPRDIELLRAQLGSAAVESRIAAAERMALLRDRRVEADLVAALKDKSEAVRMNAALALAACGTRDAAPGLLAALEDASLLVAQAANVALEQLSGHSVGFDGFGRQAEGVAAWQKFFAKTRWPDIESALVGRMSDLDDARVHAAIESLGHIGGDAGRAALREYVRVKGDGPLRHLIAAMRALGFQRDKEAVAVLVAVLRGNMCKAPGNPLDLHELGWQQRPVHLAAAAAEALGRIGTAEAEKALVEAMPQLRNFWDYTLWTGDHSWLMGCHSSVLHYRILEAFDAMETRVPQAVVEAALKAVPIDTDRGLLFENDAYESLTARVVNRSGLAAEVVEACLTVLGDGAYAAGAWKEAVTASPPAISVLPHDPESRAAEILSVVCLDRAYLPAVRKAFERYRAMAPSRPRSWVCFYLARLMGRMKDEQAAPMLMSCLRDDATEASFGFEPQPNVFVYKAMTPFYRAAAADALGRIGDDGAIGVLFAATEDFENAMSVRHAAARSLGLLCGPEQRRRLAELAEDYPEVSIRRALLEACVQAESQAAAR